MSTNDEWVMVPREIVDRFPEINPSNYGHDDACHLNSWGVELVQSASPLPPSQNAGWLPIESAPLRMEIQGWCQVMGWRPRCKLVERHGGKRQWQTWTLEPTEGMTWSIMPFPPTHWMPLPPAPGTSLPSPPVSGEVVEALRAIDQYEVVAEASMVNQLFRLKNIARSALAQLEGNPSLSPPSSEKTK